jgi:hypothetical protein
MTGKNIAQLEITINSEWQTNVGNELPVDDRYISDGSQKNNGLTIWIN